MYKRMNYALKRLEKAGVIERIYKNGGREPYFRSVPRATAPYSKRSGGPKDGRFNPRFHNASDARLQAFVDYVNEHKIGLESENVR